MTDRNALADRIAGNLGPFNFISAEEREMVVAALGQEPSNDSPRAPSISEYEWVLMLSVVENLRAPERTERIVEAAGRMASELETLAGRLRPAPGYRGFESKAAYESHYSDPKNYADEMDSMRQYTEEAEQERAALTAPDNASPSSNAYTLDELLAGMTPENRHEEVGAAPAATPTLEPVAYREDDGGTWVYHDAAYAHQRGLVETGLLEPLYAALSAPDKGGPDERAKRDAADYKIGWWLSAALEDPAVCAEMKADINAWFEAQQPGLVVLPRSVAETKEPLTNDH